MPVVAFVVVVVAAAVVVVVVVVVVVAMNGSLRTAIWETKEKIRVTSTLQPTARTAFTCFEEL
jgi:hypothetical protein